MLSTLFDKVTGLFDKRFTLALLLPAFALAAGGGALAATMAGWPRVFHWWSTLSGAEQVALGVGTVAGIVVLALLAGTQVGAATRMLEGEGRGLAAQALDRAFGWRQAQRWKKLSADNTPDGYQRFYASYPADPDLLLPTRLGNALRAAESYPGDPERWGIDGEFWWPRLYLVLPDGARGQVDDTRSGLDQMVVLTIMSTAFAVGALALGFAGLDWTVAGSCGGSAVLLARACYLGAVSAAAAYGDLVRSCYDLYRGELLDKLGWAMPATLKEERALWGVLGQQLYRRGTDRHGDALLAAARKPASPAAAAPAAAAPAAAAPAGGASPAEGTPGTLVPPAAVERSARP